MTDHPLTDQQLAAYDALAAAATPGPWHLTDADAIVAPLTGVHVADVWETSAASRNGEFIEGARTAVPALLAEVRRLRAELRIGAPWKCSVCGKDNHRDVCLICETDRPDPEPTAVPATTTVESGTRPCGHDDYHDPHEWHDRPGMWCPGISFADDEPAPSATNPRHN